MRRALGAGVAILLLAGACSDSSAQRATSTQAPATTSTAAAVPATTVPGTTTPLTTEAVATTPVTALPPFAGDPVEIIRDELREVTLDEPPVELVIAIPRLDGASDAKVEDFVNQYLLDHVTQTERDFVSSVTDYLDQVGEVVGPLSYLDLFYDVGVLNPDVLSMRFDEYTYYQGAANPSRAVHTVTVDLHNGALLGLEDMFTGSEWAFALDFLVRQAVADTYYEGDMTELDAWIEPDFVLIPDGFMLKPLGFEFSFQELTVGPAVLGAPSVRLPYSDIGVYIDPEGLIGRLAADAEVGCSTIQRFVAFRDLVFTSDSGSSEQADALEEMRSWEADLRGHRPDLNSVIDVLVGWAELFVDTPSVELTAVEMDAIEASNDILAGEMELCG